MNICSRTTIKKVICALCIMHCSLVFAKTESMGVVYPIIEVDALDEITAAAQKVSIEKVVNKPIHQWSAMQSCPLQIAKHARTKIHIPWYIVPNNIKDAKGRIVYPKGFKFNPLKYVRMTNRLVIASEKTLPLVESQLRSSDQLILCHGDIWRIGARLNRPTFILQRQLKEKLGLTYQPAIVEQIGEKILIHEIVEKNKTSNND